MELDYSGFYVRMQADHEANAKRLEAMTRPIFDNWGICDSESLLSAEYAAMHVVRAKFDDFHFPELEGTTGGVHLRGFVEESFEEFFENDEQGTGLSDALAPVAEFLTVLQTKRLARFRAEEARKLLEAGDEEGAYAVARGFFLCDDMPGVLVDSASGHDWHLEPPEAFERAFVEQATDMAEDFDAIW